MAGGVHWGLLCSEFDLCVTDSSVLWRAHVPGSWVTLGHGLSVCRPGLNLSRVLPACLAHCLAHSVRAQGFYKQEAGCNSHSSPKPLSSAHCPRVQCLGLCRALGFPKHGLAFRKNSMALTLLNSNLRCLTPTWSLGARQGEAEGTQGKGNLPHNLYLQCLEYSLVFSECLIIAC